MSNRDLTVAVLALAVAFTVGAIDVTLDVQPGERDGILNAALVLAVAVLFYRIGRNGS